MTQRTFLCEAALSLPMTDKSVPAKLFVANRQRLTRRLLPNSLAVVNANDVLPTSADATLPMQPSPDLFYLAGISQEHSILLLAPDAPDEKLREMLFVREPNPLLTTWEGEKLTKEHAQRISGISSVRWLHDFPGVFHRLMCELEHVYLNSNEHPGAALDVASRDARFVQGTVARYPLHQYHRLARILHELRAVKSEAEVKLIREAAGITLKGYLRVLRRLKPGINERDVEADFAYEFIRQGARFAYPPIVAGGANSCVLHYVQNNQPLRKGSLLLLDVAARYNCYNADVTRTIPVSGRFTPRQRRVYEAVLRVLRSTIKLAVKGKHHRNWQQEAEAIMADELLTLGLLKSRDLKNQDARTPAVKKYFMHGVGHSLGLDVHDVHLANTPFAPGWVLTVEPGIYIPEEGFAIRLEDDILVTEHDPINLTESIPIEAEEIEQLMKRR
jgi:Xaa-Pro aminopeptidase